MSKPISITSFPPGILCAILGCSPKDRSVTRKQSDLAAFARVHSTFHGPAVFIFYKRVTLSSDSATSNLGQTLERNPRLAAAIHRLSYSNYLTPAGLNRVLRTIKPRGIELFTTALMLPADELKDRLISLNCLEEFSLLGPGAVNIFNAAPFLAETALPTWSHLTSLHLKGNLKISLSILQNPKPTYRLTTLSLSYGYISTPDFEWLLGNSEQLQSLSLTCVSSTEGDTFFDANSPLHKLISTVSTLKLIDCQALTNPSYSPLHLLPSGGPKLTTLEYGHEKGEDFGDRNKVDVPGSAQRLVLHGEHLIDDLRLAEKLQQSIGALKHIEVQCNRLEGTLAPRHQTFVTICKLNGIELSTRMGRWL